MLLNTEGQKVWLHDCSFYFIYFLGARKHFHIVILTSVFVSIWNCEWIFLLTSQHFVCMSDQHDYIQYLFLPSQLHEKHFFCVQCNKLLKHRILTYSISPVIKYCDQRELLSDYVRINRIWPECYKSDNQSKRLIVSHIASACNLHDSSVGSVLSKSVQSTVKNLVVYFSLIFFLLFVSVKKPNIVSSVSNLRLLPSWKNTPIFTGVLILLVSLLIFALNLVPFLEGMFVMLMMGV